MQPYRKTNRFPTFYLRWVLLNCREANPPRQSRGMAQFVVMLLMLTILTTTLAIASRITAGLYSQSFQSRMRLARDAAEYGLTLTAHELNKPGNRLFLGKVASTWKTEYNNTFKRCDQNGNCAATTDGPGISMYKSDVIPRYWDRDRDLGRYPCYVYAKEGPKLRIYLPTEQAANLQDPQPPQYYSDNNQSFQLLSLQLYSSDHKTKLTQAPVNEKSYLVMVMQGTYNGTVSRSTIDGNWRVLIGASSGVDLTKDVKYVIQQEFEVVPRCCASSFGELSKTTPIAMTTTVGTDRTNNNTNSCPWNTEVVWILRSVTRTSNFVGQA